MKTTSLFAAAAVLLASCNSSQTTENNQDSTAATTQQSEVSTTAPATANAMFGTYVADGYAKRNEGSDWVSVSVQPYNDHWVKVKIRSRGDRKRATCTMDDLARIENDSTVVANNDGKPIVFSLSADKLMVKAQNQADDNALYFFCSGGASIAGTYSKLNEAIDATVDKTAYTKYFLVQNQSILITAKNDELTVEGLTLTADKRPQKESLAGYEIVNAETGDLDANGSPEVYIYAQSTDGSKKQKLFAYAINAGKSMTPIYLSPLSDDAEASQGYTGNDEFAIVENKLVRRFPVTKTDGKKVTRQVQYNLIQGEAMWQLEKDKITEY